MFETGLPTLFEVFFASIFGLLLGSFAGVVFERVPQRRSLTGRSTCVCGRVLKVSENIPVLGFLRARKGVSCCDTVVPLNYFVFELGFGFLAGFAAFISGFVVALVVLFVSVFILYLYALSKQQDI